MHDLRWFCSRSNFLNRPTLIFARLSTGFLENRTVFGGSFSHVRSKKPLTFPCNGQIRACHGHVCLCSQIIVNLRKLDFSIGDPSVYSTLKVIGKNLYQLKKFWLFLLNVSFKLTTRRAPWRCREESEGTPSSGGKMEVKAHLVMEGILVHRQRRIRDCLRRVASEAGPD